jgi:hypothetical protein
MPIKAFTDACKSTVTQHKLTVNHNAGVDWPAILEVRNT